jgi:tetratricopeptide (TPR) repeat protein
MFSTNGAKRTTRDRVASFIVKRPAVKLAVLFVALTAAAPAAAEWRRLDSPSFVVVGDASTRELRDVAVRFEGFRETLTRVMDAQATSTAVPTVVVVFPNDRAFAPFKPQYEGKPIDVSGVFYGGRDVNYIAIVKGWGPHALRIIFHEYTHLVTSNFAMNFPVWLSEGLAEYYSTYEYTKGGRQAIIGRPIDSHVRLLNERTLLSLDQLITVDHSSPLYNEGERRSLFYAQSWALTHMLLLGEPERVKELTAFVSLLQSGVPEMDAWRKAFGDLAVDRELQRYVRRRLLRAYQFNFSEKFGTFEGTAAPIPEADAQAFLAGLQLQQERYEEAERLLSPALKSNRDHAHTAAVMAQVDMIREDYASAATRLMKLDAVDDWFAAYRSGIALADLVERERPAPPEQIAKAKRVLDDVGRQRQLANALARVAAVDMAAPGSPSADARAAIERARKLAPGRNDYALTHAQLLAEQHDFAAAREVLGPIMRPGVPSHMREAARRWMGYIVEMERKWRTWAANDSNPPNSAAIEGDISTMADAHARGAQAFIPIYRELKPGEQRLEGTLERLDCSPSGPISFRLHTADGVQVLQAAGFPDVEFLTRIRRARE